jgi:hypothetical protein
MHGPVELAHDKLAAAVRCLAEQVHPLPRTHHPYLVLVAECAVTAAAGRLMPDRETAKLSFSPWGRSSKRSTIFSAWSNRGPRWVYQHRAGGISHAKRRSAGQFGHGLARGRARVVPPESVPVSSWWRMTIRRCHKHSTLESSALRMRAVWCSNPVDLVRREGFEPPTARSVD